MKETLTPAQSAELEKMQTEEQAARRDMFPGGPGGPGGGGFPGGPPPGPAPR